MQQVPNPYPIFLGLDGLALELGYIYIGTENLDPETNPKAAFWDEGGTDPATQPIRTLAGYPDDSGSPGQMWTSGRYSIRVRNALGEQVFYTQSAGSAEADTAGQPYFIHIWWSGPMDPQQIISKHVFLRDVSFETDLPDLAAFHAGGFPSADCVFDMLRNGASYGTLTIDTAGDLLVECDAVDFVIGDRFELKAPAVATDLEDLGGSIEGETA